MTARKRPSAADYLDNLDEPERPVLKEKGTTEDTTASRSKQQVTVYFEKALLQEARSAVFHLGSQGLNPSTLSSLFNEALREKIERLRREHNEGDPFPLYLGTLPGGRPPEGE